MIKMAGAPVVGLRGGDASRIVWHGGAPSPNEISWTEVIRKLYKVRGALAERFPDEFKNVEDVAGEQKEAKEPKKKKGKKKKGNAQADDIMQLTEKDETGWDLIQKLGWTDLDNKTISGSEMKEALERFTETERMALSFWFDEFCDRAKKQSPQFCELAKNQSYQLVAMGREVFDAIIQSPDLLTFYSGLVQDVDLAAAL